MPITCSTNTARRRVGHVAPAGSRSLLPCAISANGDAMMLTYALIADVVRAMYGIGIEYDNAMVSRVKYLLNQGLSLSAGRTRGPANLGLDDALKIAFCFEMLHAGATPQRAARVTTSDWDLIRSVMAASWWERRDNGSDRTINGVALAPSMMDDFGNQELARDMPLSEAIAASTISDPLPSADGTRGVLMIDVGLTAELFGRAMTKIDIPEDDFDRAMLIFCGDVFGSDDPDGWKVDKEQRRVAS